MPKRISGQRIARSFISPTDTRVSRELDFQLGPRQGIEITAVLGSILPSAGTSLSSGVVTELHANHTLHLETGSLETVPEAEGEDEDTIDSEVFYRQDLAVMGNDDLTTEFRASVAISVTPSGLVTYQEPVLVARNITHSGKAFQASLDFTAHIMIFYHFVEFALAELGLILARRT